MSPYPSHSLRAAPARQRRRNLISLGVALLLVSSMFLPMLPPRIAQAASAPSSIEVVLHFKDAGLHTVDFASYEAALTRTEDGFLAQVNDDPPTLSYRDNLSFAVYEQYATFGDKQRDITDACRYDAQSGVVTIPAKAVEDPASLAVVFWLSPAHPAFQRYVAAHLDTADLSLEHRGQAVTLQSDVPDVVAAAKRADQAASTAPLARLAASFPGVTNKHYQLSKHTRLENFDVDMKKKQAAYGFPSDMIGSYGFGVFFGSSQIYKDGVSTGTTWDESVLKPSSDTYDAAVDAFLGDTIAARLGSKAEFALSRSGDSYRARYVSKGTSYQDTGYSAGESPSNKALAHGTCGSSNVVNGGGAIIMDSSGDNYITYKGIYRDAKSDYDGWYKLYYRIDAKSASTGQAFQDVVGYLLVPPVNTGKGQAIKVSSNSSISGANSHYSLKNAVIAVFDDKADAQSAAAKAQKQPWGTWQEAHDWSRAHAAFTFVTKADGKSNIVEDIEAGKYYAAELFAPKGFRLFDKVKTLTIEARDDDNPDTVTFVDEPQSGGIDLVKLSANPLVTDKNPCYSLAGATYGVFTDAACLDKYEDMNVALNDQGKATAHIDNVPIGSYWVKETKRAAKGFALDPRTYPVTVTDGTVTHVGIAPGKDHVDEPPKLEPLRIMLQKLDRATGKPVPQGGASLGDAHFRINYYPVENASAATLASLQPNASWLVRTNDDGVFLLQDAEGSFTHRPPRGEEQSLPYTISGPAYYKLQNGQIGMPIGSYTLQEVKAPEGYRLDSTVHVRHINDENHNRDVLANFQAEENGDKISDEVVRADLRFIKRANGSTRLAGVPFKITSRKTGEWHILVTDKNGFASTEATTNRPHSAHTNENDRQFRGEDGSFTMPLTVDMDQLDAQAGIWFAGGSPGAAVVDGQGALPYDIYEIEEIRCPANQLFSMIRDEVIIDEIDQGEVIDLGTLNNTSEGKPALRTHAYNGLTNNLADAALNAENEACLIDRVSYNGLQPGQEYLLETSLMNRATGEPFCIEGEPVTAATVFTPSEPDGFTNVTLTFDASQITETTQLVVFETLKRGETEEAWHRSLDDAKQTLSVKPVSLHTTAADLVSGTHEGQAAEEATIVDTVTYKGLTPGREYTMVAVLMNADTGEVFSVDDKAITTDKPFVPEEPNGTLDMALTFPAAHLEDTRLVVFESLYYNESEIALHADLTNEDQTVTYHPPEEPEEPEEPGEPEEPTPEEPNEPTPEEPEAPTEPEEPAEEPDEPEEFTTEVKEKPHVLTPLSQTGDTLGWMIGGTALTVLAAGAILLVAHRGRKNLRR